MVNIIITDPAQINDAWAAMEIEDAARRAPALPKQAAQLHADLKQSLDFLRVLVTPLCAPEKLDALDTFFALANDRADQLAAIPQQATEVLTHSAFLVMQLMKQRNAVTNDYGTLVEALESGDENHPLLQQFAEQLDERRMDYSHLEAALGVDEAGTVADLFLGRGNVPPDELSGLIVALIGKWEGQTGQRVSVHVHAPIEEQSA